MWQNWAGLLFLRPAQGCSTSDACMRTVALPYASAWCGRPRCGYVCEWLGVGWVVRKAGFRAHMQHVGAWWHCDAR